MMKEIRQIPNPLKDFPKSELWRLFIDGYRQNEGPLAFDVREKGYLAGALNAFDYLMTQISEPVSTDMILNLHNIALDTVNKASGGRLYHKNEFSFRGRQGIDFGMVLNTTVDPSLSDEDQKKLSAKANFSEEGLQELVDLMRSEQGKFIKIVRDDTKQVLDVNIPFDELAKIIRENSCKVFLGKDTIENIHTRINSSIKNYYLAIQNSQPDDEKLIAIIRFVKDLEVNHYFTDANCRTTVCLLMNKLLIDNGFCPSIHENPNRVDGYSTQELTREVKNGMERFKSYSIQPENKLALKKIHINSTTDMAAVKTTIERTISTDPLCALAQLNHLASNITESFGIKTSPIPMIAALLDKQNFKKELRECLNTLYIEQVNKCLAINSDLSPRAFSEIIANHKIFNENPNLVRAISQAFTDRQIEISPAKK